MKNRLHGKKAGMSILAAIIIITLAEVVFRSIVMGRGILTTPNAGEQVTVIVLALALMILSSKGKDRTCYICYGAWLGYFALDQLFELPAVLIDAIIYYRHGLGYIALSPAFHALSMICVLVIGILLIEYMVDGSIYNRAYNTLCVIAILGALGAIIVNIISIVNGSDITVILASFHNLYRLAMVFMFAFFAYDSAKLQLSKMDLSK